VKCPGHILGLIIIYIKIIDFKHIFKLHFHLENLVSQRELFLDFHYCKNVLFF